MSHGQLPVAGGPDLGAHLPLMLTNDWASEALVPLTIS